MKVYLRWVIPLILVCTFLFLPACESKPTAEEVLTTYFTHWNKQNYEEMYGLISPESKQHIKKKDFIQKHKMIVDKVKLTSVALTLKTEEDDKQYEPTEGIPYEWNISSTTYKELSFSGKVTFTESEEGWRIQWKHSLLFPDLTADDSVEEVRGVWGERGQIRTSAGEILADNKKITQIGVIPQQIEKEDDLLKQLATQFSLKKEDIKEKLEAKWVKPYHFIPIAQVDAEDSKTIENAIAISGVSARESSKRHYPYAEVTAHFTGYMDTITDEQLKTWKEKGYREGDWVGHSGLEESTDARLRGVASTRLLILDHEGRSKKELAATTPKDGEDVVVTLDLKLQKELYNMIKGDAASAVAFHPKTGALLAAVSYPSFDPNVEIRNWNQRRRFAAAAVPGSTMKPLTAAIGLETEAIKPDTTFNTNAGKWQKDSSWGGYFIRRVSNPGGGVDLNEGMAWSDNIYFARTGVKVGAEEMEKYLRLFGFGQKIPSDLFVDQSQFSNSGQLDNEILLADTSYGQGQLLISPYHLALTYTPFVNEGNLLKPQVLIEGENEQIEPQAWQEQLISKENAASVYSALKEVVTKPSGTAHDLNISGATIAAKTGTAELKASRDDKNSIEYGWLTVIAGKKDKEPDLLITTMFEGVQNRGGSHYNSSKLRPLLQKRYQ
ncbi:penicillin-binding transpeptidase domain-containing protein [Mechercharimyces sp. CAU 1602]|uniref:penicillin-binding transpeptidase domain-containing protein n=1 Tax=Mechercharimyces sp. CAU 1602 TaxID=2973933 RepID=UPI002163DC2B|nr:penicillin-binding transpeptidase domain-containing protein [Mechercharimyces sp. CAU 1602]MCS1351521.1 penicillin-binding transpeptidase domain-containing protein [Mechercharimyces sp. CAU 1602]